MGAEGSRGEMQLKLCGYETFIGAVVLIYVQCVSCCLEMT